MGSYKKEGVGGIIQRKEWVGSYTKEGTKEGVGGIIYKGRSGWDHIQRKEWVGSYKRKEWVGSYGHSAYNSGLLSLSGTYNYEETSCQFQAFLTRNCHYNEVMNMSKKLYMDKSLPHAECAMPCMVLLPSEPSRY